jgi:uncharacterized membrane protein
VLLLVFVVVCATIASIVFNIPVLRQILGFLALAMVPGALILNIMRIRGLGLTERILLSVGLSLSFVIIVGLLINSIYPYLVYDRPLSERSVVISFSVIILLLCIIAYSRNRSFSFPKLSDIGLTDIEKVSLIIPSFFPLLSIVGMYLMNRYDINAMAIGLLLLILIYVALVILWRNRIPGRIYPFIIFLISLSLLLVLALRSRHLIGIDTNVEYYIFQNTLHNERWQIFMDHIYEGCLSISILPTVFHSVLNIDPEYLFKVLYPILFSICPVVVFVVSRQFLRTNVAFLGSLLFMSQTVFLATTANARSSQALLFFSLVIMVLFHKGISDFNKRLLFVILAASCVLSHYTTSYILFFLLFLTWLIVKIVTMVQHYRRRRGLSTDSYGDIGSESVEPGGDSETTLSQSTRSVTAGEVLILFVFIFIWQSQVVGVGFSSAVDFISNTFKSIPHLFQLEARGETAAAALGYNITEKGIPQLVEFLFSWLTVALIVIGILATTLRYIPRLPFVSERRRRIPRYLYRELPIEFFVMALIGVVILALSTALPYVFAGYDVNRTYMQMTVLLSMFFAVGGIAIAKLVRARYAYLLILIVLVPYFLCTTGTLYQAFGSPRSIALNSDGFQYDLLYTHDQETASARWLSQHAALSEVGLVEADHMGIYRLIGQGQISPSFMSQSAFKQSKPFPNALVFLTYVNVTKGLYFSKDEAIEERSLGERQNILEGRDILYSNGGSEIWK